MSETKKDRRIRLTDTEIEKIYEALAAHDKDSALKRRFYCLKEGYQSRWRPDR